MRFGNESRRRLGSNVLVTELHWLKIRKKNLITRRNIVRSWHRVDVSRVFCELSKQTYSTAAQTASVGRQPVVNRYAASTFQTRTDFGFADTRHHHVPFWSQDRSVRTQRLTCSHTSSDIGPWDYYTSNDGVNRGLGPIRIHVRCTCAGRDRATTDMGSVIVAREEETI